MTASRESGFALDHREVTSRIRRRVVSERCCRVCTARGQLSSHHTHTVTALTVVETDLCVISTLDRRRTLSRTAVC